MLKRNTKINELIAKNQSILILGPRGTGKSFYINHLLENWASKLFKNS
jgi:predicted AAA+ superfamily ATPase